MRCSKQPNTNRFHESHPHRRQLQHIYATYANYDFNLRAWWSAPEVYGVAAAVSNVTCLTPARPDARSLGLEVSLNAQQYTADGFQYVFYEEIELQSLHPLSGPREVSSGAGSVLYTTLHVIAVLHSGPLICTSKKVRS